MPVTEDFDSTPVGQMPTNWGTFAEDAGTINYQVQNSSFALSTPNVLMGNGASPSGGAFYEPNLTNGVVSVVCSVLWPTDNVYDYRSDDHPEGGVAFIGRLGASETYYAFYLTSLMSHYNAPTYFIKAFYDEPGSVAVLSTGAARFPNGTVPAVGQWINMRMDYDIPNLKLYVKMWPVGSTEPFSWMVSSVSVPNHNDASFGGVYGGVMVGNGDLGSGNPGVRHVYFDNFYVGVPISPPPPGAISPDCIHDSMGRFHRVAVLNGDVSYWRSDTGVPIPWAVAGVPVTAYGNALGPRLACDPRGVLRVVLSTSGNVVEGTSTDNNSWSYGSEPFAGCTRPAIAHGRDGQLLRAAYDTAYNTLDALVQWPGSGAPSIQFEFFDSLGDPIQSADDDFDIRADKNGRWFLSCVLQGQTQSSEYQSWDNGTTWAGPTVPVPGAHKVRPRFGNHGQTIRAGVVPGTTNIIQGTVQWPGETAASAVFTFVDSTAMALSVSDDWFGLSADEDGRWLLSVVLAGGTAPVEYQSWDNCRTWTAI